MNIDVVYYGEPNKKYQHFLAQKYQNFLARIARLFFYKNKEKEAYKTLATK